MEPGTASDQGTHFTAAQVQQCTKDNDIRWYFHVPRWPQTTDDGDVQWAPNGVFTQADQLLGDGDQPRHTGHSGKTVSSSAYLTHKTGSLILSALEPPRQSEVHYQWTWG